MVSPASAHPSAPFTHAGFLVHEWVGMLALLIVMVHWLWSIRSSGTASLSHLFPLDRNGRSEIAAEIRGLLSGHLAPGGPQGGLAGLVHGLGLVAVTAMAVTGGVLFMMFPSSGEPSTLARNVGDLHSSISKLV